MRVAIVHYWLFHMRGGERVLEALCELFPQAHVYTHVYDAGGVTETIRAHEVRTTLISRLPAARRAYKAYLPLMPLALRLLDLSKYDLVISSESGPAKGVRIARDGLHVCYCHSPMRYAWDMASDYLATVPVPLRWAARLVLRYMRAWDVRSASAVNHFIANSEEVRGRMRRQYGRDAEVVYPPVDVGRFRPSTRIEDFHDYYLVVSHLVRYKRVDLAVDACSRLGRRLIVIGSGSERKRLEARAGPTVTFLDWQPDDVVAAHYARCRALLFPGQEDFGIVPVEAMAAGRPVVAFRKGGALETVLDGETGIFFDAQSVDSLCAAMLDLEARLPTFDPQRLRTHAERFSRERFKQEVHALIERWLESANESRRVPAG